ncbi:hypothetical protein Ddc_15035 [Ditylenchus destructor]|nr:hypothetical protein Ddc_15035 [Ditylenchus destructor]
MYSSAAPFRPPTCLHHITLVGPLQAKASIRRKSKRKLPLTALISQNLNNLGLGKEKLSPPSTASSSLKFADENDSCNRLDVTALFSLYEGEFFLPYACKHLFAMTFKGVVTDKSASMDDFHRPITFYSHG